MTLAATQLLKFAGLFTWACVGVVLLMLPWFGRGGLPWTDYMVWGIAHMAFGAAYWQLATELNNRANGDRMQVLLLGVMTISALELSFSSQTALGGFLLLIVAGVLPWTLPLARGIAWMAAQNIGLTLVMPTFADVDWSGALFAGAIYLGYSSFAFVVSLVAQRQSLQRDAVRKVNSELRATQALLAQSTRITERLRISRELHDLVGHHLTGLTLNLEVASHLVEGKAREHIEQAKSVAKLLLADVREVVSTMRESSGMDLSHALLSLSDGVPEPDIHMDIPTELSVEDPQRAQVILRCTQEIITNTVKHANAENLWFRIEQNEQGLSIHARDDGRGIDKLEEGNGLLGMGERLRQLGGKLSVQSELGEGFSLDAWLPKEVTL